MPQGFKSSYNFSDYKYRLHEIPNKYFEEYVKWDYRKINVIPDQHKSVEMARYVIRRDPMLIEYFPEKLIDEELLLMAVDIDPVSIVNILRVYPKKITKNVWKRVLSKQGNLLFLVPDNQKDQILCNIAVQNMESAIQFVPNKFLTRDMCRHAKKGYKFAEEYIPKELFDEITLNPDFEKDDFWRVDYD